METTKSLLLQPECKASLRVLIALSVQCGLKMHQVDVTTAFLIGNLEEEVYMTQPKGFVTEGEEYLVCKLKNMASSNHPDVANFQ